MRAVFGLLLIMLGLALAIVWMPEHDSQRQLAVVTDIATQGISRGSAATERGARTFSPQTPLITAETSSVHGGHIAATARVASAVMEVAPAWQAAVVSSPASVVTGSRVTGTLGGAGVSAQPTGTSATAPRPVPMPEMARDELVRNLQRELKRVGCYWGDVDGDWGIGSRRAMSSFTERMNAALPVDQPDIFQLSLLRAQSGVVCGRTCPSGQTLSDSGRCTPNAVVAQQTRRRTTGTNDTDAAVTVFVAGGAGMPAPIETGLTTRVARTSSGGMPASTSDLDHAAAAAAVAAASGSAGIAVAAAMLPKRMALAEQQPQLPAGASANGSASSAARRAVRGEVAQLEPEPAARPAAQRRERRARSGQGYAGPAPRGYGSTAYRPSRAYYGPVARRSSRSWTATFFGGF